MPPLNILISGSGIAGAVFASWLLRAYPNASITIVERGISLRLTGASVDIRSSGVDIIKSMGLEPTIRDACTHEAGMQVVDANGREIATFAATGRADMQSMTSEYEIFRGELARIFLEPVRDKVKILFGEEVASYKEDGDKVFVRFKNSGEVKEFDLLVAADGLNSKIRGWMLDCDPAEHIRDEGVYIAYFTIKTDLLKDKSLLAKGYNAPGGRLLFLRPDPDPEGRTRGNLMKVTLNRDVETKEKLNRALKEGDEACKQLMEEMFTDVGWLAPEILQGMRESDDFYCSLFAQVRAPRLRSNAGHVVLLGDAAYATPGFGTSLAIIGAYVLAGELLQSSGDVKIALERYEDIMLPFSRKQQGGIESAMQWMCPQTGWGITVRNAALRVVTGLRIDRMAMWGAAMVGFTEKKPDLPEYQWPAS